MVKAEYIPYNEALKLKLLGFNEECDRAYTEEYKQLISATNGHTNESIKDTLPTKPFTAPTFSQVFKWFRDNHKLEGHIKSWKREGEIVYYFSVNKLGEPSKFNDNEFRGKSYEDAELECIKKLINLISHGK